MPSALRFVVGGVELRVEDADDGGRAFVLRPGRPPCALPATDGLLHLRAGTFDPLAALPEVPAALRAPASGRLFAVQFHTAIVPEYRAALLDAGFEVVGYWPSSCYLVRGERRGLAALQAAAWVRWVGDLEPCWKLDDAAMGRALQPATLTAVGPVPIATEYNVVLTGKDDRDRLIAAIVELGGEVTRPNDGSIYLQARLTPAQLLATAARDEVLWIDPTPALEFDLSNARVQGGANTVEFAAGVTGHGVRVHVLEGLEQTHPDWLRAPMIQHDGNGEAHGHCTAMIIGGSGQGNTNARGILPDCQIIESSVYTWAPTRSRYRVTEEAVDPAAAWRVVQQTASWGYTQTLDYNSSAAELDDVLFDLDVVTTQSQSNSGDQWSRPQAWAKNVISVGGVFHMENTDPADDSWDPGLGASASIGPASDGRLKPDVCGYFDGIQCGDLTGAAGYSPTDYHNNFGGTSGATPMVNGFVGLLQEMFTDGLFGHALPLPATSANRFANRPHMTTVKALLLNTAASYAFSGAAHDLTRTHQGWGFPAVDRAWGQRQHMLLIDEGETLAQGESRTWYVHVAPGTPEFRATMVYADPPALPSAAIHRINSLDLQVTRFADGVSWWGNHGLDVGNQSAPGGAPNDRDTVENVWLQAPAPGIYAVTVRAPTIVQDGHVETAATDVDFALAVHPLGGGYRAPSTLAVDLISTQPGDLRVQVTGVPATGWSQGMTFVSFDTARPPGFGSFFGVEYDVVTEAGLGMPPAVGDVFRFVNAGPGFYPFAPFVAPTSLALALRGVRLDAVVTLFTDSGEVFLQSAVDRVTVQ